VLMGRDDCKHWRQTVNSSIECHRSGFGLSRMPTRAAVVALLAGIASVGLAFMTSAAQAQSEAARELNKRTAEINKLIREVSGKCDAATLDRAFNLAARAEQYLDEFDDSFVDFGDEASAATLNASDALEDALATLMEEIAGGPPTCRSVVEVRF